MSIRIVESTGLTLLQDSGRFGMSALGVGPSGVFDRRAFQQANLLLGNDENAAVIEHCGGTLKLTATRDHAITITGALGPLAIDAQPIEAGRVVQLAQGSTLTIKPPIVGLRYLVAVAGGFNAELVLGSRSRDTLAHLGPEPLQTGSTLNVGFSTVAAWAGSITPLLPTGEFRLRVVLGPRDDWFTATAIEQLLTTVWEVDPLSGRVGIRLNGPNLERCQTQELLSEGVVRGSIQVTNNGMPIILGPDHPVTGGYPVIGVITDSDTDLLAHVRPGDTISLSRHLL